jgi:hypothetical protein
MSRDSLPAAAREEFVSRSRACLKGPETHAPRPLVLTTLVRYDALLDAIAAASMRD